MSEIQLLDTLKRIARLAGEAAAIEPPIGDTTGLEWAAYSGRLRGTVEELNRQARGVLWLAGPEELARDALERAIRYGGDAVIFDGGNNVPLSAEAVVSLLDDGD